MNKKIKLIVAHNKENIIGINNALPWRLKSEMQHFVAETSNNIVIMGKNTLESLPCKMLKNRHVIAVSSQENDSVVEGDGYSVRWATSLESAIKKANELPGRYIYIAGGTTLYRYSIENMIPDELVISVVDASVDSKSDDVIHYFNNDLSKYYVFHMEIKEGFKIYRHWKR